MYRGGVYRGKVKVWIGQVCVEGVFMGINLAFIEKIWKQVSFLYKNRVKFAFLCKKVVGKAVGIMTFLPKNQKKS